MRAITKSEGSGDRKQRADLLSLPDCLAGAEAGAVPLWKRFLDLSLIAFTAPAWAPIMLGIGAAIKILSPGPVLFRQARIGLGGKPFVCLKFRTMHAGTNTAAHEKHVAELVQSNRPMTKLDGHDPRLIPLARLLRSTGFDELPQLLNVIRGEMSIVGPRPCTPKEYEAYSAEQRGRSGTLPGLTGLWQVNGKNDTTFREMVKLDLNYVSTMSFWLDLTIILRTPLVLLGQVAEILPKKEAVGLSRNARFLDSIRQQVAPRDDSVRGQCSKE